MKRAGIFGGIDNKTILLTQFDQCQLAISNGLMPETVGFREHEDWFPAVPQETASARKVMRIAKREAENVRETRCTP